MFDALSGLLIAERSEVSLADLARRLGSTEVLVKRLLHAMRERYRALLRAEVADTVETPIPSMKKSAISAPHSRSALNNSPNHFSLL